MAARQVVKADTRTFARARENSREQISVVANEKEKESGMKTKRR